MLTVMAYIGYGILFIIVLLALINIFFALNLVLGLVIDPDFIGERKSKTSIFFHALFCMHDFKVVGTYTKEGSDRYTHRIDIHRCRNGCGVEIDIRH